MNISSRTQKLIGSEKVETLKKACVLIVGVGGVGGAVLEMLVRAGIGNITVVDGDCFDESNINRQLLALADNIGVPKVEIAQKRAISINPDINFSALKMRFNTQTSEQIFYGGFDYCVDCIDSVKDKIDLIVAAHNKNIPIIAAMGAGNRLMPSFAVMDISKTAGDGLAKAVRQCIKNTSVTKLKTVCDTGVSMKVDGTPGSISYAPVLMGCMLASEVIKDLLCL